MTNPKHPVLISLVIPVYNEEENIWELYNQLIDVLSGIDCEYEIIFVDDGSTDATLELIEAICEKTKRVKLLSLARNFGHQIALTAGLQQASGDIVITLDADLQHPPPLIPEMIEKWSEGYDVVYTTKIVQEKRGMVKRLLAKLFYKVFAIISDVEVDTNASDFRRISRKVLAVLNSMPEQQRFIRGLVSWMGFRQIRIPYKAPPRFGGRPKYNLRRLGRLASYGIASFSTLPLRAPLYIGLPISFTGFVYGIYLIGQAFFSDSSLSELRILLSALLITGGLILTFLGIQGFYMANIYQEVRKRPLYTVKKTVGLEMPPTRAPSRSGAGRRE
jgi:dolichol-phosphate mannosyltransferase